MHISIFSLFHVKSRASLASKIYPLIFNTLNLATLHIHIKSVTLNSTNTHTSTICYTRYLLTYQLSIDVQMPQHNVIHLFTHVRMFSLSE